MTCRCDPDCETHKMGEAFQQRALLDAARRRVEVEDAARSRPNPKPAA